MPEDVTSRVIGCIAATQHIPAETISVDSTFEELGIDSLDGINILFAIENEFDISIPDRAAQQVRSVREMITGVERLLEQKASGAPPVAP
jgi:acyl carrier protein